jgi:hypothetical protein
VDTPMSVKHDSRFKFVAQGALVVAYRHLPRSVPSQGGKGKRGKVTEFSDRSRKRLARLLHRLSPAWGVFITLTVADASLQPNQVKRTALRRVLEWLEEIGYEVIVWKQEFQQRGAVHYHLLALCWHRRPPWVSKKRLANKWGLGFVDVQFVQKGRLVSYVAKYVRKPVAQPATGASPETVPPAEEEEAGGGPVDLTDTAISDGASPGRFWGIRRRENLVWAKVKLLGGLPERLEPVFRQLVEGVRGMLGFTPGVLYLFSKTYLTT